MATALCHPATVLVIDPSSAQGRRIVDAVGRTNRLKLVSLCKGFEEAYNLTEQETPDIVVIAAELTTAPGFPMFRALLQGLGKEATILSGPNSDPRQLQACGNVLHVVTQGIPDDFAGRLFEYVAGRPPRPTVTQGPSAPVAEPIVVIGASTGGVEALVTVLSAFPEDCPPTLIVQHMGHGFVSSFTNRLDRVCRATVVEAQSGFPLKGGQILIAPGAPAHLTLDPSGRTCRVCDGPPIGGHRPSVDALFRSAAPFGSRVIAALLTGMGRDGADGLKRILQSGGHTLSQDEATSVVYGMPRVAKELGASKQTLPIDQIGPALLEAARQKEKGRAI